MKEGFDSPWDRQNYSFLMNFRLILIKLYKFKFFKRLVPSLLRKFFYKNGTNIQLENFRINLNTKSSIDREIFLKGFYDKNKIDFIENNVNFKSIDYFLDIGAYIGYYSLYFNSKYKNIKILTFEPILESFNQIKKSLKLNFEHNITPYNLALSDTKGVDKSWVTDLNKKSGFSIYDKEDLDREVNSHNYSLHNIEYQEIKKDSLDNLINLQNKNLIFKIDVERHELKTIKGAKRILSMSNNKIFIQVEIVDNLKEETINLLKEYGFNVIGFIKPDDKRGGTDYYLKNYDK